MSMQWPETLDDLQFFVSRMNTLRPKFAAKILAILHFTKDHPEYIPKVGGAWMNDGRHFIINSKIVGNFLDLKANSVNTNFRDHDFKIFNSETDKIRKQFPELVDVQHWKMRMHTTENFSSETTLQAANDLPFAQSIPSQADFSDKIIPKELMTTFLRPEIDKEIIYSLYQIYNSLEPQDQQANLDEKWYSNLLLHLCRVWKSTISQTPETDFVTAVNCLLSLDDSLIEEFKLQLDTNLTFFFEQREDCSQLSDTFSFDSFVKYFIRYGCTTDLLQTLKEITYFDQSGFEPLYFPLTSSDIKAKFVGWFSPYHRNDHLIPNPGDWICNPSNKINVFSLHCRQEDDTIISIHIYHNPTEDDQNRRYSVNFKDGVKTSPTLDIMFRDILSLRYTNTRPNTHAENSRGYEKYADVIVNKNKENQQTEQQQNEHEEDKFASGSQITDSQFLPFMQFSGTQNSQNGFGPFDSQSTFF